MSKIFAEQLVKMANIITELECKEDFYKELNKQKEPIDKFAYAITTESYGVDGLYLMINDDKISVIKLFEDCKIDINGICGGELDKRVAVDIIKTVVKHTKNTILFSHTDYVINAFKYKDGDVVDYLATFCSELNANKERFLEGSIKKKLEFDISIGSSEQLFTNRELHLVIRTYKESGHYPDIAFLNISKDSTVEKSYLSKLNISDGSIDKIISLVKQYLDINITLV